MTVPLVSYLHESLFNASRFIVTFCPQFQQPLHDEPSLEEAKFELRQGVIMSGYYYKQRKKAIPILCKSFRQGKFAG